MDGIIGTMTANEAQIEGTGEKVNLFDYHVKADKSYSNTSHPTDGTR